ncbi:MAG: biopolymer transporter ExbD [Bacteroidetes Order II. Incertae sedis bacterium]|nr:biopolymer transporter ExbD [Bacteroidetes Order II. bacterium]
MAETALRPDKKSNRRSKKHSTYIDFTPMVDLAFILISFFMLTTTLAEAKMMELIAPKKATEEMTPIDIAVSHSLSLLLLSDNRVAFHAEPTNEFKIEKANFTTFSSDGLRKVLRDKKQEVTQKAGKDQNLVVLIKPTSASSYKNLVDVIDELNIANIRRYALMDPDASEVAGIRP